MKRRKMKRSVIVIIGMMILVVVCLCIFLFRGVRLTKDLFMFSYDETIPNHSSAYFDYGWNHEDVQFDKDLFSMNEIGSYEVQVTYEEKAYTLHIELEDRTPPTITIFNQDPISIFYNEEKEFDLRRLFEIEDVSETSYKITPEVEQLQEGKQEVCIYARDSNGNSSEACQEVNLHLEFKKSYAVVSENDTSESLLLDFMKIHGLNESNFGFFYYSPEDGDSYVFNKDKLFNAASTIKVPLNMLYYDKIAAQEMSLDTTLKYNSADSESGGGYTSTDYKAGSSIPLSYLLEQSIVFSDNTATNILIRNLGTYASFRSQIAKYSDEVMPPSFLSENVVSIGYMFDVLTYLYDNSSTYATLIDHMKLASEGEFLQASTNKVEIAQKYGDFNEYLHSVGIVYTKLPYLVGIYTQDCPDAYNIIVDLNKQLLEYQALKLGATTTFSKKT